MNRKSRSLFILVGSCTAICLGVGWLIGLAADGGLNGPMGAGVGGIIGTIIGSEIGHRRGLFEAPWDRIVMVGPEIGFAMGGAIALASGLGQIFIALVAVIGSGVGALIAKYIMRFFVHDPPPSILR